MNIQFETITKDTILQLVFPKKEVLQDVQRSKNDFPIGIGLYLKVI